MSAEPEDLDMEEKEEGYGVSEDGVDIAAALASVTRGPVTVRVPVADAGVEEGEDGAEGAVPSFPALSAAALAVGHSVVCVMVGTRLALASRPPTIRACA